MKKIRFYDVAVGDTIVAERMQIETAGILAAALDEHYEGKKVINIQFSYREKEDEK